MSFFSDFLTKRNILILLGVIFVLVFIVFMLIIILSIAGVFTTSSSIPPPDSNDVDKEEDTTDKDNDEYYDEDDTEHVNLPTMERSGKGVMGYNYMYEQNLIDSRGNYKPSNSAVKKYGHKDNPEECEITCRDDPTCVQWTYYNDTGKYKGSQYSKICFGRTDLREESNRFLENDIVSGYKVKV